MRRTIAIVEVDGEERKIAFFKNNFGWAVSSICDLCKSRWSMPTSRRPMNQALHLGDFLGHGLTLARNGWRAQLPGMAQRALAAFDFPLSGLG